jgi:lipopolysaccharide transport system ATP-binding protein
VGDAEFQMKCLGKMGEVSKGEGRTVLFVSHNLDAVNQLCSKSLLLKNGSTEDFGNTLEIVTKYLNRIENRKYFVNQSKNKLLGEIFSEVVENQTILRIRAELNNKPKEFSFSQYSVEFILLSKSRERIAFFGPTVMGDSTFNLDTINGKWISVELPNLVNGKYELDIQIVIPGVGIEETYEGAISFSIENKLIGQNNFVITQDHKVGNLVLKAII